MRYIFTLIVSLLAHAATAQNWEDQRSFGNTDATTQLRILSSTDTTFFAPIIDSFLAESPDIHVEYLVTGTASLDQIFRQTPNDFDIVISSAMDLQLKLVNDGFAQPVAQIDLPDWAKWRDSLFAFTNEPAAIVINRAAFAGHPLPETRQDLIEALRARPDVFRGRLATYDVRTSGLGYLFATQDARATETFWRLMEVMGSLDTQLACCSGDMIDGLISGEIAVAYNVLGSYALARAQKDNVIEVILPADFPTTMMRTALISAKAQSHDAAVQFVQHLLALQSQTDGPPTGLPPLLSQKGQSTIALEPALMTYLDALKRRTFLAAWESAVIQ